MKIQIMGGKITENLGFESLLRKVKKFVFTYYHFYFSALDPYNDEGQTSRPPG